MSYWHPPKLLLPTRLHSNTFFCLLSFFYLLETLELHLVARRLSPGGPSRGTPLIMMESSTLTPTSLRSPLAREPAMYSISFYYFLYLLYIGQFLDIHKSILTVQLTAKLDRAKFKTQLDLQQRFPDPPPYFYRPSPCTRIQEDIGAQTVQRRSCECQHQQRLELDLSADLSTPKPFNSL